MNELETDRLILRPLVEADLPIYRPMWENKNVTQYLSTSEQIGAAFADRAFKAWTKRRDEQGYAPWAMVRRSDNAFMGHCGLQWIKDFGAPEVLYMLDEPYWGEGYATEGAMASVAFGLGALRLDKIAGMAFEENRASCRVLEKCGLSYVKPINFHGDDLLYYERIGT